MEDRDFAHALRLDKGVEIALLYFGKDKSLTQVVTILVEVDDASVLIDEHSNEAAFIPVAPLGRHIRIHCVIVLPSSVSELVSCGQIDGIEIYSSGQIMSLLESFSAGADDDSRLFG